ncbi:MAG: hypothetical protein E6Q97_18895 [Desulfurellales bacterium]|nr:MAG: hypothetical protein E6Q97_18895 [Desulfurellales bacterium]
MTDSPSSRRMDDYLMHRIELMEAEFCGVKDSLYDIKAQLDRIEVHRSDEKEAIDAMKGLLSAGGLVKWAISGLVGVILAFVALLQGWEVIKKWLGK